MTVQEYKKINNKISKYTSIIADKFTKEVNHGEVLEILAQLCDYYIETEIGSQDIITQKVKVFRLFNGDPDVSHSQGIFISNIDISFRSTDGQSAYGHPFNNTVGISFQKTPVHVCARVSLVAVANDVFFVTG